MPRLLCLCDQYTRRLDKTIPMIPIKIFTGMLLRPFVIAKFMSKTTNLFHALEASPAPMNDFSPIKQKTKE